MNDESYGRAPINELVTLLQKVNPGALSTIARDYPQFREEIEKGPSAGAADVDRKYYSDRADIAQALALASIEGIDERADGIIRKFLSLQRFGTVIAIGGALGGISVLTSVGFPETVSLRVSSAVTSLIAVLNAGVDVMTKRYSSSNAKKAVDAKQAALTLRFHMRELALMVASQRDLPQIVDAIEKCNEYARQILERKNELMLV
jgi:hypothetical protein